jgi:hypothetical protein
MEVQSNIILSTSLDLPVTAGYIAESEENTDRQIPVHPEFALGDVSFSNWR